jgi:ferredoxin--NADP+ reductase
MCPNISYIPVVSRGQDDPTWRGLTGYLQEVLLSGEVESRTGVAVDPSSSHVFLCGNPAMIEEAKARLVAERGYVPDVKKEIGTLHLEEYW